MVPVISVLNEELQSSGLLFCTLSEFQLQLGSQVGGITVVSLPVKYVVALVLNPQQSIDIGVLQNFVTLPSE